MTGYLQTNDDKPTLLFFHHTLSDGDGDLLDVPRLFEIVKAAPAVKGLVFGHSHVYSFTERDGVHLINLPASGYNFNDAQPVGWVEAQLTANGAEFRLHAVGGQHRSQRTHHRRALAIVTSWPTHPAIDLHCDL